MNFLIENPGIIALHTTAHLLGSQVNNWTFDVKANAASTAIWSATSSLITLVAAPVIKDLAAEVLEKVSSSLSLSEETSFLVINGGALAAGLGVVVQSSKIAQSISSKTRTHPISERQADTLLAIALTQISASIAALASVTSAIFSDAKLANQMFRDDPMSQERLKSLEEIPGYGRFVAQHIKMRLAMLNNPPNN